jgi:hypothetical protein
VWLLNPKWSTQKVAICIVNVVGGEHKFYFNEITEKWFKVDMREALLYNTTLMYPDEDANHKIMVGIMETVVIRDQKYIKIDN